MSIGVLGKGQTAITFEASADKILTWQEARRQEAARWHTHEVYQGKPLKEFLGPGLSRITLAVQLHIDRGVVPRDVIRDLRKKMQAGEVQQLTIGGELVGDFTIEEIADEWRKWSPKGVLMTAGVTLSLEEYV